MFRLFCSSPEMLMCIQPKRAQTWCQCYSGHQNLVPLPSGVSYECRGCSQTINGLVYPNFLFCLSLSWLFCLYLLAKVERFCYIYILLSIWIFSRVPQRSDAHITERVELATDIYSLHHEMLEVKCHYNLNISIFFCRHEHLVVIAQWARLTV